MPRDDARNQYRGAVSDGQGRNDENTKERLDRELIELLNELRVALPGVQVLLAFMLALPFTQKFGVLTDLQRDAFVVALLSTSCAIVLFMTPTSYHRLRFREGDKEQILTTSNRLSIAGIALMGLGLAAVVFLVMDVLFSTPAAVAVGLALAILIASLWFALPLIRRMRVEGAGEGHD